MLFQQKIQEHEARTNRSEPTCALSIVYEGAIEGTPVHPPDLSFQGMFINTPKDFSVGTVLKLNFRLVGSGLELNARGKVRHCMPGVGVGVEFVDLSPEARRAIEAEIQATVSMLSAQRRPV